MKAAFHALCFDFGAEVNSTIVLNSDGGRWRLILLVHVLEVFRVTGVLGDILNVHRNVEFDLARFGPVLITDLLNDGDFTVWLSPCGVEPHVNFTVYFAGRPVLHLGAGWNRVAVRDVVALTVATELPAVERTLDRFTHHFAVDAQMRTEVRAKGIVNPSLARFSAVYNQLPIESADRFYVARFQLMTSRD